VREAPKQSKAPARNKLIASSAAGEHRRQKSDNDEKGFPSSTRMSNFSDTPFTIHKGTRIKPSPR
jgi:hypothetical protein